MEMYLNMSEEDKKWYTDCEYSKKMYERRLAFSNEHFEDYKNMLIDVCKSEFNLHVDVMSYNEADRFAYIDHQSDIFEDPDNARMFESSDKLIDFLTSYDSYIRTGNDNGEPPVGWHD
jgi:nickel-dependent lactate racemase